MMTNMDATRLEATRRVMKALARLVAREPLPVRLEDGSSPIVVALPDDTVLSMSERVQRVGGVANVVVACPDSFVVCAFEENIRVDQIEETADVHHLSTVGLLLDWIESTPNSSGSFRVRKDSDTDAPNALPVLAQHEYAF